MVFEYGRKRRPCGTVIECLCVVFYFLGGGLSEDIRGVQSSKSDFQVELTFFGMHPTRMIDVRENDSVASFRSKVIEIMQTMSDHPNILKAAGMPERWRLVPRCAPLWGPDGHTPSTNAEEMHDRLDGNTDAKLIDFDVCASTTKSERTCCQYIRIDYKPKKGEKMGLRGGAWGGSRCAAGWFTFMGSLQTNKWEGSSQSIDQHTCGVSIFPVARGLRGVHLHGHSVQALGLTAKHCVRDRDTDRDILFSGRGGVWVSLGTHHVNSAHVHFTVLGYTGALGAYDAGNDVAVLFLGKVGPRIDEKTYDMLVREPAPSIGRPFKVRVVDSETKKKTAVICPKTTSKKACEAVKGCRAIYVSGHLRWKKYRCERHDKTEATFTRKQTRISAFALPKGARGGQASLSTAGWGHATSADRPTRQHNEHSRAIAQHLQCIYHLKQRGSGFDRALPSVNVEAPPHKGINRGDSGGPIVWTSLPGTVVGVLSTGEISGGKMGKRANYMNLEAPSRNALFTLCYAWRTYAWAGLEPHGRPSGGEWLKEQCDKRFVETGVPPSRIIVTPSDAGRRDEIQRDTWVHFPDTRRDERYHYPIAPPAPRGWFVDPIMPIYTDRIDDGWTSVEWEDDFEYYSPRDYSDGYEDWNDIGGAYYDPYDTHYWKDRRSPHHHGRYSRHDRQYYPPPPRQHYGAIQPRRTRWEIAEPPHY